MSECPCRFCEEHTATCHATCKKGYKEYADERKEKREAIYKAKQLQGLVLGHFKDVRQKQKKSSWKKDKGQKY